jgi:TPR repeat protein
VLERVAEIASRRDHIQEAIRQASQQQVAGDYVRALDILESLLADDAASTAVRALRSRIEKDREEAEHRQEVVAAVDAVHRRIVLDDLTTARAELERMCAKHPHEQILEELLSDVKRRTTAADRAHAVAGICAEAAALIQDGRPIEAGAVLQRGLLSYPGEVKLLSLLNRAALPLSEPVDEARKADSTSDRKVKWPLRAPSAEPGAPTRRRETGQPDAKSRRSVVRLRALPRWWYLGAVAMSLLLFGASILMMRAWPPLAPPRAPTPPAPLILRPSPAELSFDVPSGQDAAGTVYWSDESVRVDVHSDAPWLTAHNIRGEGVHIEVGVRTEGVPPGSYLGSVAIQCPGRWVEGSVTLPVHLTVYARVGQTEPAGSQPNTPQQDAKAMVATGRRYEFGGAGTNQDFAEAMKWFRKAADLGNGAAMNLIGGHYFFGLGVAKDYAEALKWYRRAADAGSTAAMNHLSEMYTYGRGVTQDHAEAMRWYEKAAAAGNQDARHNLERHNNSSVGPKVARTTRMIPY